MPYLHRLEDQPDDFLKRLERFVQEVDEFGGNAIVEPEVYDYAATVKNRTERDARRRELMSRVGGRAGAARLAETAPLPLPGGRHALPCVHRAGTAGRRHGFGKAQPLEC